MSVNELHWLRDQVIALIRTHNPLVDGASIHELRTVRQRLSRGRIARCQASR